MTHPAFGEKEFRRRLSLLRFIDRTDLPATSDWDDDWPSFRDDPYRYYVRCSDRHQSDIWSALKRKMEE